MASASHSDSTATFWGAQGPVENKERAGVVRTKVAG